MTKRKTQTPGPRPVTATALPKEARVAICLETVLGAAPLESQMKDLEAVTLKIQKKDLEAVSTQKIQKKDLEAVTLKSQDHNQVQALTPALPEATMKDPTLPRQIAVHHPQAVVLRRVVAQLQAVVAHHKAAITVAHQTI